MLLLTLVPAGADFRALLRHLLLQSLLHLLLLPAERFGLRFWLHCCSVFLSSLDVCESKMATRDLLLPAALPKLTS
jgi:hypothetical protein